jgi:hypothetical protein
MKYRSMFRQWMEMGRHCTHRDYLVGCDPAVNLDAFLCSESNFDSSVSQRVPYHLYELSSLVLFKGATALLGMGQKR